MVLQGLWFCLSSPGIGSLPLENLLWEDLPHRLGESLIFFRQSEAEEQDVAFDRQDSRRPARLTMPAAAKQDAPYANAARKRCKISGSSMDTSASEAASCRIPSRSLVCTQYR
ncbi:MAG TPA: hypothetical protein DCK93_14960 [Blastocatellia bacterium]|nr:hypothetical protein [Blastocatellia bacterium]HAF24182.1 hypothetical protein [Blastocatellia bacterium]